MSAPAASGAGGMSAQRWIIAPAVALAAFMEVLDISIANVALRHIAGNLSATQEEATWVLTSYLVTNAIIMPMSGWLANVFGRRNYFLACIAGFGASSLLCGLAPNLFLLIVFRTIQGLTGGGLQPNAQAILADTFPPEQRPMAFALYGLSVVFAPAIGPTLGGWITDNFSWHWVFLINVPVSIALFFLAGSLVRDPERMVRQREKMRQEGGFRLDYIGFGFLVLGLGALQLMLDKGQQNDWFDSTLITGCAIASAAGITLFVLRASGQRNPLVDIQLLARRNFAIAFALMFMLGFTLLGSTAMIPLYVQSLLGYTATDAGMVLSPGGFAIMFMMPIIGRLGTKVQPRWLMMFGLSLIATSMFEMSQHFTTQADYSTIAILRIFQALGIGFMFGPITASAYAGLPVEKSNAASSLINLARNLGGSVGIALLTTLVARHSQSHHVGLVEHIARGDPQYEAAVRTIAGAMARHGGTAAEATQKAQAVMARQVDLQAAMLAYNDAFLILSIVMAVLIPLLFLMPQPGAETR